MTSSKLCFLLACDAGMIPIAFAGRMTGDGEGGRGGGSGSGSGGMSMGGSGGGSSRG